MNWANILKRKQIKNKRRGKSQVKQVGDTEDWDNSNMMPDETLNTAGDNQMTELSELTRQDLKEQVLEMIDNFSKEQLIELLEETRGDIEVESVGYRGSE